MTPPATKCLRQAAVEQVLELGVCGLHSWQSLWGSHILYRELFFLHIYIYNYIYIEKEREREIISNVKLWCDSWLHLRQLTLYSYDQNQSKSGICIFSISVPRNCPSVWGSNVLTHTEYRCSQHFFPTKWCTLVDWEEHPTKDTMDHGPNTPECRSKRNE